jgi:dimethylaniline monooxygenase (N-oxide forming)
MEHVKTIGIIGAGVSGLTTAKTCLEYGYSIKVFERDKELGGVWASSQRYPGVTTQNTKDTYYFSDFPMPKNFPQWPSGEQVQSYLTAYAKKFNVFPFIKLSHEITNVNFKDNKWLITGNNNGVTFTEQTDFLIICNGTFSDPIIPEIKGMDNFIKSGGKILHSTQFHSTEISKDKNIAVIGYGKSASDLIGAASETAKKSYLIFREPKWKIPRFVKGINMKYLLLNRLGESFIKPVDMHNKVDRFVHKIGMAKTMLSFMEKYITKTQMLKELELVPSTSIQDQAFNEISLETPGFFEKVNNGKIIPKRGEIESFEGKQITLTTGEKIECDLVIFGVGFRQTIPFLPEYYRKKFTDERGNYLLYHHILPPGVPSLAFVGYNSSIQCPITSEFAGLWICEYLKGRIAKPTDEQMLKEGTEFIKWRSQFRMNGALSGLSIMPGTIHHVDLLLKEMNAPMSLLSLIPDWLVTSNPGRYKKLRKKIIKRNARIEY